MRKAFSVIILYTFFLAILFSCKHKSALDTFIEQHPIKSKDSQVPVQSGRTMTLLLGSNNRLVYFLGDLNKPVIGPVVTGYGKDSLGKAIQLMKAKAQRDTTGNYLIVLVKRSDKSTYKNFVATIDLIKIIGVQSFGLVDITPKEVDMLKKYHTY